MNRKEFIRAVAKKAGFTLGDTKWFVNGMIAVFAEAIEKKEVINIRGLGKLWYRSYPKRKGYNPFTKEYEEFDETDIIMFTPAHKLRDILREPDHRVCKSSKEYREKLDEYLNASYGEDEDENESTS